jgi:N-acetylmuramoyl-L-alanine amidase
MEDSSSLHFCEAMLFIEIIMIKLRQKTLKILIAILATIILLLLANLFMNKNGGSILDNSSNSTNSATSDSSTPEFEKHPTVIIDAGHGGWDPGAGKGSISEKEVTLAISLEVEKVLKEKNIDYYMLRNDDTYISFEDRVKIANEKSCKLFVSIHNNSFTDSAQSGILTTYNPNSPTGKEIAEIMQSKINNIGMKNRDVMPRPNLYVLRHTDMPAILLEIGFISNQKDLKLLTDVSFQQKCAKQIVLGIEEIIAKYVTGEVESSVKD